MSAAILHTRADAMREAVMPAGVAHAVLVLRNELAVLHDGRRCLVEEPASDMTDAMREHLLAANFREVREVREALRRIGGRS